MKAAFLMKFFELTKTMKQKYVSYKLNFSKTKCFFFFGMIVFLYEIIANQLSKHLFERLSDLKGLQKTHCIL